jgi:SPP1 gp7 family putative phage head morphogenesis protein
MPADGRGLYDDAVRRRIALERYSNDQIRKTLPFLKEVERDLIGRLAVLRSEATTRSAKVRLASQEKLLASVQSIYAEAYAKLSGRLQTGMTRLAGSEAERVGEALADAAGNAGLTFTTNQLTATAAFEIAAARPMQGALLKDWLDDIEPSHRRRIEQALRISFAEGESLETAMNRLRGATKMNENGLAALIRTSNAHIATSVTEATYEANADIIEGVEWVSVLDSRTTPICRARDGKRYPPGEGPRPPAHIGCRSTTTAVLIGVEPLPRETYSQWLKRQPAATQNDILGPTRGRMFRDGALSVDRFVDMKGKTLSLEELGYSSRDPLFKNYVAQMRTPGAAEAAKFFATTPEETGRIVQNLLGEAGPLLKEEGRQSGALLSLNMKGGPNRAYVSVTGDGFLMEREFTRQGGNLIVENKLLSLDPTLQGKGYGTKILQASVQEYKRLGVTQMNVTANIDVGGYTWAKMGYAPKSVAGFREAVMDVVDEKMASGVLTSADKQLITGALRAGAANPKRLPATLAKLVNAEGKQIGKEALLGSYWEGYLDLTDADALAFFEKMVSATR